MIHRDGICTSLWQAHTTPYETTTAVSTHHYDVIVIGGGITGISTALLLQEAGKKCLVLEARNLCFGTTGGTTAHLNTLLDTPYTTIAQNFGEENAVRVANATHEAIELISTNIKRHLIDCEFKEASAFLFARDKKQEKELEDIRKASEAAGLDIRYTSRIPVPIPCVQAVRVTGQAKFNPTEYVYGLARVFESLGGVILQDCPAQEIDDLEVLTIKGRFSATDIVYATHIPPGINLLHLRCAPYRSYAMAVTLENNDYPEDLSYDMYDPYNYYRTQVVDGQKYLIAGGMDHKTGHVEETEQHFRQLEAHVRKYFAVRQVHYRWSSQYFESADGLPYIGHLPGTQEHIFVATGYGGNGMVYSSVAALLLRHLILNEPSPYTQLFDPNRIKPVAGFTNFIKHNADVVKQFAGKFLSHENIPELASLAPGEGKVVKYEDQKLAIYKSESGEIHAIHPACTHMRCEVKWNNAERSWDCPCHGARYDVDGNVLTGPADRALEQVQVSGLMEEEQGMH
jgi:hypothetical protein